MYVCVCASIVYRIVSSNDSEKKEMKITEIQTMNNEIPATTTTHLSILKLYLVFFFQKKEFMTPSAKKKIHMIFG